MVGRDARHYIATLELPAPPRRIRGVVPVVSFDEMKNQALVVGSDIISFTKGVTADRRQDIANAALLAQLVAKKRVPDSSNIYDWFSAYFDVLSNIGWVIQERSFVNYAAASDGFEVHEAILHVAASLLGPAAATMDIVKATLNALKSASDNSPWITIFNRESQSASTAHFQVALAYPGEDDQLLVALMAFGLEASSKLTQVLVFKMRTNSATLKRLSGTATINPLVLTSVRDDISARIAKYSKAYLRALPDLD